MKKIKRIWKIWAFPLACGLLVLLLFRFVLILGYVPSDSMQPVIMEGSYVWGTRLYGELQRGNIVIFKMDGRNLVKRIAAGPGDTVSLDDQTHTTAVNSPLAGATRTLVVPEGHYFLLGDNSAVSIDSRYWEEPFIAIEDIIAKLIE